LVETKADEGSREIAPRAGTSTREMTMEDAATGDGLRLHTADIDIKAPATRAALSGLDGSGPSSHSWAVGIAKIERSRLT
jgi:hypothetical protein